MSSVQIVLSKTNPHREFDTAVYTVSLHPVLRGRPAFVKDMSLSICRSSNGGPNQSHEGCDRGKAHGLREQEINTYRIAPWVEIYYLIYPRSMAIVSMGHDDHGVISPADLIVKQQVFKRSRVLASAKQWFGGQDRR